MIDRAILLFFAALCLRWPMALLGVVVYAYIMHWQAAGPYPLYITMTDKRLPFDIAAILTGFIIARRFCGRKWAPAWLAVFMLLVIVGAQYYWPGYLKLERGPELWSWITDNTIADIAIIAHAQGYKPFFLPDEWFVTLLKGATFLQIPIGAWVNIGQLAGLFILFHRRLAIFLLFDYVLLHMGIFFLTGIFFWKWIIVDFALAIFLLRIPNEVADRAFLLPRKHGRSYANIFIYAFTSLALIVYSSRIFLPVGLAWFDSRGTFSYNFFAVGESGKRYQLHRNFFEPFDVYFAQNRFYYLDPPEDKYYIGVYGGGSYGRTQKINEQSSLAGFLNLLETDGKNQRDEKAIMGLGEFFQAYFVNYNEKRTGFFVFNWVGRPNHILADTLHAQAFHGQENVVSVEVEKEIVFFNKKEYEKSEPKIVFSINIPNKAD